MIVKEWNSVKLHATVMNTLFRKDPNGKSSIEPQPNSEQQGLISLGFE